MNKTFIFYMNNRLWQIKEMPQEMFKKKNEETDGQYFGSTFFDLQEIWLDKELNEEAKRQTLKHELMHCYIGCYISLHDNTINFNEENLCDISSNSNEIIHDITENYFEWKDRNND